MAAKKKSLAVKQVSRAEKGVDVQKAHPWMKMDDKWAHED